MTQTEYNIELRKQLEDQQLETLYLEIKLKQVKEALAGIRPAISSALQVIDAALNEPPGPPDGTTMTRLDTVKWAVLQSVPKI